MKLKIIKHASFRYGSPTLDLSAMVGSNNFTKTLFEGTGIKESSFPSEAIS